MAFVGYSYLIEAMALTVCPLKRAAVIKPVTRISVIGGALAVPASIAPAPEDFLAHVLFALKHEGTHLTVLAQALPHIPAERLLSELANAPNGIYLRKTCFLWEHFTGQQLNHTIPVRGASAPLFDPQRYLTGPTVRNARWRIDFNGLGTLDYCATVERTEAIQALLDLDILGRCKTFMSSLPAAIMDRAISWAYLHETRDSFAIEKEAPSEDKSSRFIQLLRKAHEREPLNEAYLVSLQNSTIRNPFDMAAAFRHEQNHLHNGLRGAAGVSYVPPAPDLCRELMESLMTFANDAPLHIDPLVAAAIVSFGFVFLHPFMDGNGRLSRFLIHQALCRSGALENGLLLPVSVAMKREEARYLEALQDFSRPVRTFWDVRWIDAENLAFNFNGDASLYRYWDATCAVTFTLEMARQALEVELRDETRFLQLYDHIVAAVNDRFDVRGSDLSNLVMMCLDNQGTVSKNRRKQYQFTVPEAVFEFIEQQARQLLSDDDASASLD